MNEVERAAKTFLKSCEVYSFGSAATGRLTAASDIDILVVAESLPQSIIERAKIKEEIERLANLPFYHPIQIHLATENEVERSSIYSKAANRSRGNNERKRTYSKCTMLKRSFSS
mgnify:CR=1 FL=1